MMDQKAQGITFLNAQLSQLLPCIFQSLQSGVLNATAALPTWIPQSSVSWTIVEIIFLTIVGARAGDTQPRLPSTISCAPTETNTSSRPPANA